MKKVSYLDECQKKHLKYLDELKDSFDHKFHNQLPRECNSSDYEFIKTLGVGAFGTVKLVKRISDNHYYATKILDKAQIIKMKQVQHTLNEKNILQAIKFPFVVNLECSYKDNSYLYISLPFIGGGEMFTILRKMNVFKEDLVRFYAAQVILALEYLHHCDLIHRDLKPENILVDVKGYIRITDFGFCKLVTDRTFTLCGTPEYLAPEIILTKPYGKAVDWWSFGILVYEMIAGHPPFHSTSPMKIYQKAIAGVYKFDHRFGVDERDLIKNTLQVDVSKRFGNLKNGVMDFKTHKWFKYIDWDDILKKKMIPPFKPKITDLSDAENFEKIEDVPVIQSTVCLYESEFKYF